MKIIIFYYYLILLLAEALAFPYPLQIFRGFGGGGKLPPLPPLPPGAATDTMSQMVGGGGTSRGGHCPIKS